MSQGRREPWYPPAARRGAVMVRREGERERRQVWTPSLEGSVLAALLVVALFLIGACLYLQGVRPAVGAALRARRSEAGRPMVMQRIDTGQSEKGRAPVPISAMLSALRVTGAPGPHASEPARSAALDLSIDLGRGDCARLVRSLGGRCRGPVRIDAARPTDPAQLELRAPRGPVHLRFSPGPAARFSITQSSLATQQPIPSALTMEMTPTRGASATVSCVHSTPTIVAAGVHRRRVDCVPGQETYETQVVVKPWPRLDLFLNGIVSAEGDIRSEKVEAVLDGARLHLDGDEDGTAEASPSTVELAGSAAHPVGFHLHASGVTASTGIAIRSSAAAVRVDGDLQNPSEYERLRDYILGSGFVFLGLILAAGIEFAKTRVRGGGG
jgi:hypothetical protein